MRNYVKCQRSTWKLFDNGLLSWVSSRNCNKMNLTFRSILNMVPKYLCWKRKTLLEVHNLCVMFFFFFILTFSLLRNGFWSMHSLALYFFFLSRLNSNNMLWRMRQSFFANGSVDPICDLSAITTKKSIFFALCTMLLVKWNRKTQWWRRLSGICNVMVEENPQFH